MKRLPWFEILLVSVLMAISLYAALSDAQNLSWRWFTRDDAYYYFKVAQNIGEGHGSTFDGLNLTNGYHPLWMLVCIPIFALARFDLILPLRILLLVMGALSAATAVLFYRLLGRIFHPIIGALAALYWVFNYDILQRIYQQGLETGLAIYFILLLVYKLFEFEKTWRRGEVTGRQLMSLGLIALLTVYSRLDLIFLAGMVGIWLIFRNAPIRIFLPLDITSILISVLLAFILRLSFPEYFRFADVALTMIAVSLVTKLTLAYFLGLYQPAVLTDSKKLAIRLSILLVAGTALTTVLMLVLAKIEHFEGFPRITLLYDFVFTGLLMGLSRFGALGLKTIPTLISDSISPWAYLQANWKIWFREGLQYFGVVGAGMALYMLYNKIAFGTFSPVSGQIKRWWGSLPGRVYEGSVTTPLSFFGIDYAGDANAFHPFTTVLGSWAEKLVRVAILDVWRYLIILGLLAGLYYLVLFINKQKSKTAIAQLALVPLLASSFVQVLYYHVLGYSAYKEWYWTTQLVLVVLVCSAFLGLLFRLVQKNQFVQRSTWVLVLAFGFYMALPFWSAIRGNMTYNEWQPTDPNNDIAAFLEEHTEPGSIIGFTGGGNAGYFIHDRTVINMDGLINSYEYFQKLQNREAGEYLAGQGMNYILANYDLLDQLPYRGQFTPYVQWTNARYGGKDLLIFRIP